MIGIHHGRAFDEMDSEETSSSYQVFCQPINCALSEEPLNAHCISLESDKTISRNSSGCVSGVYSDIFADYDIHPTILGTGNYGCVRECLRKSDGEKYAVKTIDKSKISRRDHIQREIQLLRSIDHHGIMKMVDCYEDEAYFYIVTERYTGGELFDKIVGNTSIAGCLAENKAAKIAKSLLEAVQYLHSKDIVHRDIKPENVLFETKDEGSPVKLIDFGLSRIHGIHDDAMKTRVGTPYYMNQDILRGRYDRSCDIWAVGVLSYILLCGYPPFNGTSDFEIHASVLRGGIEFEKDVWEHLSKHSRDFVSKILCMDLSRISSVEEALQHPWITSV